MPRIIEDDSEAPYRAFIRSPSKDALVRGGSGEKYKKKCHGA